MWVEIDVCCACRLKSTFVVLVGWNRRVLCMWVEIDVCCACGVNSTCVVHMGWNRRVLCLWVEIDVFCACGLKSTCVVLVGLNRRVLCMWVEIDVCCACGLKSTCVVHVGWNRRVLCLWVEIKICCFIYFSISPIQDFILSVPEDLDQVVGEVSPIQQDIVESVMSSALTYLTTSNHSWINSSVVNVTSDIFTSQQPNHLTTGMSQNMSTHAQLIGMSTSNRANKYTSETGNTSSHRGSIDEALYITAAVWTIYATSTAQPSTNQTTERYVESPSTARLRHVTDIISSSTSTPATTFDSVVNFRIPSGPPSSSGWTYIAGAFAIILIVLLILAISGFLMCRRHVMSYSSLPSSNPGAYDYIYRPLHGNRLDEEYENTFVGVSIPLLQEVTIIWENASISRIAMQDVSSDINRISVCNYHLLRSFVQFFYDDVFHCCVNSEMFSL